MRIFSRLLLGSAVLFGGSALVGCNDTADLTGPDTASSVPSALVEEGPDDPGGFSYRGEIVVDLNGASRMYLIPTGSGATLTCTTGRPESGLFDYNLAIRVQGMTSGRNDCDGLMQRGVEYLAFVDNQANGLLLQVAANATSNRAIFEFTNGNWQAGFSTQPSVTASIIGRSIGFNPNGLFGMDSYEAVWTPSWAGAELPTPVSVVTTLRYVDQSGTNRTITRSTSDDETYGTWSAQGDSNGSVTVRDVRSNTSSTSTFRIYRPIITPPGPCVVRNGVLICA